MKAFPIDYNSASIDKWQGMDLRDYFAAKAMQSVMVSYNASINGSYSLVSRIAYEIADAMMEARK